LPTYVPPAGPAPDVPGTDIIPPGFQTYPKTPTQSVASPPGDGGDITVAGEVFTALIPVDQNTLWQQLNKSMNVNLKLNLAPFSDWAFGKFQALVAGGDLPDITMIPIAGVIPDLPSFLEARVQDLTPFVSGDAVKEYPNLAALPTIGWKGMVYNSKIFAVPIAQSQFYWGLWRHQEILDANNLSWPKSAMEFRQQMKQLTDPNQNRYGIGFEVGNRYAFGNTNVGGQLWPAIYGAPNNWGVSSDGKWTKDWETDQFKAGIQLAHDVFADGSFDPSTTYTTPSADDAFESGKLIYRFSNATNVNHFDTGEVPGPPHHDDAEPAMEGAPGATLARGCWRQGPVQPGNWQLWPDRVEEGGPAAYQAAAERDQLHRGAIRESGVSGSQLRRQRPGLQNRRQWQSAADPAGTGQHDQLDGRDGRATAGAVRSAAEGLRPVDEPVAASARAGRRAGSNRRSVLGNESKAGLPDPDAAGRRIDRHHRRASADDPLQRPGVHLEVRGRPHDPDGVRAGLRASAVTALKI
jgi:hypothetical protein